MEKIMDIRFPHLGIEIAHLGRSITIGGFSIAYYGMIIALGMILGFLMASWQANAPDKIRNCIWTWQYGILFLQS